LILGAACVKALIALWVRFRLGSEFEIVQYATSHGDSMLFAAALVVSVALWIERRRSGRGGGLMVVTVPLLLAGIVANQRRLAWMELSVTLLTLYCITPWTRRKRSWTRAALCLSPLLVAYVAVGWNSTSRVFGPVQLFRSVQDGDVNRSTLDRDVENFNLVYTIGEHPVLGSGLGHPYTEAIKGDDISRAFAAYRFVPHNSVLWLWAAGGVIGFLGLWAAPVTGLVTAAHSYFQATSGADRVVAFAALAALQIYMIQCWGDMGLSDDKAIFLVGSALGVAARLPMSTPSHRRDRLRPIAA
jgi:hypothetical protein